MVVKKLIERLSRYTKKCITDRTDEDFANALEETKSELNRLRNELCLHCGRYKKAHLGYCDGCRWKDDG